MSELQTIATAVGYTISGAFAAFLIGLIRHAAADLHEVNVRRRAAK